MGDLEDIDQDSDADEVVRLQRALISLGYLNGSADGSFGSMSANAVSDFQTAVGLQATGVATPITQQLLFSLAGTAKVVRIYGDPSKQFAAIEGKCAADLSSVKGIATVFEYDDISGSGFISNGNSVVSASTGGADIDSYAFTVVFGFSVSESKGEVAVRPAVRIVSESVRRPIMQKLTFKSGDAKASIKVRNLENSVSGSRSVESSTVNLNEEISALLAAAADAGELKVRIEGKYQNYDIEVPAEQLSLIAKAGAVMGELLAQ